MSEPDIGHNSGVAAEEVWVPVPDHDGYEVSTTGRVRSLDREQLVSAAASGRTVEYFRFRKGVVLKHRLVHGYRYVPVFVDGKRKNRRASVLIAAAFHGPRPAGHHVCHRDGCRDNDTPSNLYYGTPSENAEDKWRHGTMLAGSASHFAKLRPDEVLQIRSLHSALPRRAIATQFGISVSHVDRIGRGECWRATYGC